MLQKKVAKAAERQRRSDERRRAEEVEEEERENREQAKRAASVINAMLPIAPIDARLEVDLEADDDSDGNDEEFNVNTLKLGRYSMRSSRFVAH